MHILFAKNDKGVKATNDIYVFMQGQAQLDVIL
jgi:hypothetical protein